MRGDSTGRRDTAPHGTASGRLDQVPRRNLTIAISSTSSAVSIERSVTADSTTPTSILLDIAITRPDRVSISLPLCTIHRFVSSRWFPSTDDLDFNIGRQIHDQDHRCVA